MLLALWPGLARAWIHPEHRQIGVEAWKKLSADERAVFEGMWQRARFGYSAALCPTAAPDTVAGSQVAEPCIDLASWPALAGDHSCSPRDLLDEVLPSRWVHDVARVSASIERGLTQAGDDESHDNLWIESNLRMQEVDKDYVTRAGANNAHFLLADPGNVLTDFVEMSSKDGAPLNALGLYFQYHAAALRLARSSRGDSTTMSSSLARKVLALEAYALHFLQDMFASGHVAGTWGEDALRKGTHDYYCVHGYSTTSWDGETLVMYGDAHMKAPDLQRSAAVMARSMAQLAAAMRAAKRGDANQTDEDALATVDLDSCRALTQPPPLAIDAETRAGVLALLGDSAKPGPGPTSAAWPRYHADFGRFLGFESTASLGSGFGGYQSSVGRAVAELGIGIQLGFGLEGVVGSVNTGTLFLHLGIVRQSEQPDYCFEDCASGDLGSATLPRVPSRAGITLGLRAPFWLIPGDLLILAPLLALTSPEDLTKVAIRAASGGLIPWQRTFSTSAGYFELVAGRVVYLTFYGASQRTRTFAYVPELASIGYRSVSLTLPAIEWTPFRAFAQTLVAQMQVQLAYAVDIPFDIVRYPGEEPGPSWSATHMVLARVILGGRGYY